MPASSASRLPAWVRGCVATACLLFASPLWAIDAQVINGTSNQYLYVYYDTDSIQVGQPVNVHVVGSVSGHVYEYGGDYNRSWEGGNSNFSVNPNGAWHYSLNGHASIDRWMTITPTQAGTYRVGLMLSSFPSYEQAHAYINFDAWSPTAVITSPTSVSRNQGQDAGYQITASNSPTSFGASGLPNAAAVNTGNGAITGRLNVSGAISSSISASNSSGGDTKTLTWNITAAALNPAATVNPTSVSLGNPVTLTRAGNPNFGLGWTEGTVWKPDGTAIGLGTMQYGSQNYTPPGAGTYTFQFRIVDVYSNYADQWINFTVTGLPAPTGFQATTVHSYSVALAWNTVSGATGYNVYRNGTKLNSALLTGTTYTDNSTTNPTNPPQPGTAYAYTVKAVAIDGTESSATLNVTTAGSFEVFTPLP